MALSNKKFYFLNCGTAILLFIAIVLAVLFSLKLWTRHGESITLPDFKGLPVDSLLNFAKNHNLHCKIIDSVYNDTLPKGIIVMQDPYPFSGVKKGRNIYISIVSSLPEMVIMPDVVNLSVRQAVSLIYGNNLAVKNIEFTDGFDKNSVQKQLLDGQEIEPNTKLRKNTAITLLVSKGEYEEPCAIPNLTGLTKKEAVMRIFKYSFNLGHIAGNNANDNQLVISQTPTSSSGVYPLGYKINIRVSTKDDNYFLEFTDNMMDSTIIDEELMLDRGTFTEDDEKTTEESF